MTRGLRTALVCLPKIRLFGDVEISGVDIKLDGICQVEGFSADLECVMFVPGDG